MKEFTNPFASMTDEEIQHFAINIASLTSEAQSNLISEIRRRKIKGQGSLIGTSDEESVNNTKKKLEEEYYLKYRALGFTDEEIEQIIIRILEDR